VQFLAAAGQPLGSQALLLTTKLSRLTAAILTAESFASQFGLNWSWAAELLQQLLNFAVAAGLLQALPSGSVADAVVAISKKCSSSSRAGDGSSSSSESTSAQWLRVISNEIAGVGFMLMEVAGVAWHCRGVDSSMFTTHAAVADIALQLLAMRSWQMHGLRQQQQQGQRLVKQLGRRMRGDLLLLQDPQGGPLLQLLPAQVFLDKQAKADADACARDGVSPGELFDMLLDSSGDTFMVLLRHVDWLSRCSSSSSSSMGSSSPVLSAAALQLSAELLLQAGMNWQRQYMQLSEEQQQQLLQATPDDGGLVVQARKQLMVAEVVISCCCQMLQKQTSQLWNRKQWQQPFQLLQQGGGQVLLQGLTLAVHCSSLDRQLQGAQGMAVGGLLKVLQPFLGRCRLTSCHACCWPPASYVLHRCSWDGELAKPFLCTAGW
jgi:hypothetical protein